MKRLGWLALLFLPGLVLAAEKTPAAGVGSKVATFKLRDYRGAERSLDEFASKKAIVLAFVGVDCPVARQYGPRLASLAKDFESKGVAFVAIDPNQQDGPTEIARYAKEAAIEFPILKDVNNVLADQLGVQRTTEVFVLDPERVIRYRGRIDDQYNVGINRPKPQRSDLAEALKEILAGKPVSQPTTPAVGCFVGRVHKPAANGAVTYTKDIAKILNNRCVECHRAGEIGPFSMTSYEEVVGWADTIDEVVKHGRMPPWHADPRFGHFANDSRLTDAEKKLIADWVQAGTPQGDPKDLPKPPVYAEGWRIPKPDVIFTMPKPFKVPSTGAVEYQFFAVDTGFTEDKWVRAAEVKPSCRAVVHHVLVFVQPPDEGRPQRAGGRRGFIDRWLTATVPGARPTLLPEGMAKRVPAGSRLIVQIHYTPTGVAQEDQCSIGLTFADPKSVRKEVVTEMVVNHDFKIPANDPHYKVEATRTLDEDEEVQILMPHTHVRGSAFKYEAVYPDGAKEVLLDVPNYDFNWQNSYVLDKPKALPKGTELNCVAYFNNSTSNLANPNPNMVVRWGEQTWEEMMIGYYDRTLSREDRIKNPPPAPKPYVAKVLPKLDPELEKLATAALGSQDGFNAFAKAVHDKLPQIDRLCVTSVTDGNLVVEKSAYPGKTIPHIAETGFKQTSKAFMLTAFALFNQFAVSPDTTRLQGMDMQLMSKTLKSSAHVPVILEGRPGTVNFWSTQPKAFSQEQADLLKSLATEVAKAK
jgi:peroxiredoxin/mono/diheme cytochrome c family protein